MHRSDEKREKGDCDKELVHGNLQLSTWCSEVTPFNLKTIITYLTKYVNILGGVVEGVRTIFEQLQDETIYIPEVNPDVVSY